MANEFEEAKRAFESHGAFEREGDAFAVTTTPFEARVRPVGRGGAVRYRVTVRAPTIDAAVEGEEVAPVIREGWFETFERRMEDVSGAIRVDPEPPVVSLHADAGEIVVESAFESERPARAAEDAKAFVDYVDGTYLEGVIPGYDYREPVAGMVARAQERAEGSGGPPL